MSFSFNFLAAENDKPNENDHGGGGSTSTSEQQAELAMKCGGAIDLDSSPNPTFGWLPEEFVHCNLASVIQNLHTISSCATTSLYLQKEKEHLKPCLSASSLSLVRRIQEDVISTECTTQFRKTDLVPGVYEGGLKVWECSIDLCQYLYQHNIDVQGHILELGCGHGLPSCWILKNALVSNKSDKNLECFLVFSDYNEFVLRDVTLKNVVLNACDASAMSSDLVVDWLSRHVAFGAGNWNTMSKFLLGSSCDASSCPTAVPKDGLFDFILAAETTYSEAAAVDTAQLIVRHLRLKTGVAYVATKRYYFGVRGGTSSFVEALKGNTTRPMVVQVVQAYDNGAGNIRELLFIQDAQ
ncbi:lysine methyltransferase [Nitzschia inconspicua]|uniref:Lysine methyltransferase n=1 Tax=Nitzschia inconspicua TaxID=303405 RepID=A0A9K3KNF4_9STRA|nr:lysine methyltransferase [Nitzschia inconspicua]